MARARPRNLRKKAYRARSAEDRCPVCGNMRKMSRCENPYCKRYNQSDLV
jgi:hypothetical protein